MVARLYYDSISEHDRKDAWLQIERDEYLRTFQAYTNRFRHSYEASYSTNPLYYSTDIGRKLLAHHILSCALPASTRA